MTRALTDADGLVTSEGTVYPLLTRLREEGLVETTWEESRQGPPRRYYRITNDGRDALKHSSRNGKDSEKPLTV